MKLRFSAGTCFVKKLATDKMETFQVGLMGAQPLNVSLSFRVPQGDTGAPGGDAALSVVAGADIFSLDSFISVFSEAGEKLGDLFRRESMQGLRSEALSNVMVRTSTFGATPSPVPFHPVSSCDTTSPVTTTDKCTPADQQWQMGNRMINYTDTVLIPRAKLAALAKGGIVKLYLGSDVPGNALSQSANPNSALRLSPITLAYPLMHCFMKAIKSGARSARSFHYRLLSPLEPASTSLFSSASASSLTPFISSFTSLHRLFSCVDYECTLSPPPDVVFPRWGRPQLRYLPQPPRVLLFQRRG